MKKITAVILVMFFLTGCLLSGYEKNDILMGTFVTQKLVGKNSKTAAEEASKKIKILDEIFSVNIETSEVSRINNGEEVFASYYMLNLITLCQNLKEISGGSFDISTGRLTHLWGFGTENAHVPDDNLIKEALKNIGKYDVSNGAVYLFNDDVKLDFGAVVKGLATDLAVEIYNKNGVEGVVSVGGSIGATGEKTYKIGIRNPNGNEKDTVGFIKIKNSYVSTSGDYERCFEEKGKKYHHLIDAKTGFPAQTHLRSVTVTGPNGTLCDGLSTVLFLTGEGKAREILELYPDFGAVFITDDNKIKTFGNTDFTVSTKNGGFVYENQK